MKFLFTDMFDAMTLQEIKQIKNNPDIARCFAQQLTKLSTTPQRISGAIIFFLPTASENALNKLYLLLKHANLLSLDNLREFGASRFCELADAMASSPQEHLERLNNILALLISTGTGADSCLTQENFTWILKQPNPKTVFLVLKQYHSEKRLNHDSMAFIKVNLAAKHAKSIEMLHLAGKLTAFALTAILNKTNFKLREDILELLQSMEILSLHLYTVDIASLMAKSDEHLNHLRDSLKILNNAQILKQFVFTDKLPILCELEEQAGFLSMVQKLEKKNLITLENICTIIFHNQLLLDKNINLWVDLNGTSKSWGWEFIKDFPITQSILNDYFEICSNKHNTTREKRQQLKEYRTTLFTDLKKTDPDTDYEDPFLADNDDIETETKCIKSITNTAYDADLDEDVDHIKNITTALIDIVTHCKTLNWGEFIIAFNQGQIKTLADAFLCVDLKRDEIEPKNHFLTEDDIYNSEKIFSAMTPTLIPFFDKKNIRIDNQKSLMAVDNSTNSPT